MTTQEENSAWQARRREGFDPIELASRMATHIYGHPDAPKGKQLIGTANIPFSLVPDAQGHKVIELHPDISNRRLTIDINPANVERVKAIYFLLSAGDTRRIREEFRFERSEIGRLIIYFRDNSTPQEVKLRLGFEIREWVSRDAYWDVIADAEYAEEIWRSPDQLKSLDMLRVEIEDGPKDVSRLQLIAEVPDLPADYPASIPSIRLSGVTYEYSPGPRELKRSDSARPSEEVAVVTGQNIAYPSELQRWAGAERVTLAVTFTDIVRSTALGNALKDEAMDQVRQAHFQRSRNLILEFGGYELKTIGDSFMVVFKSVDAALNYALALHEDTGHNEVRIRAGIHIGPVRAYDNDIWGSEVDFAARVKEHIEGAEIWLSDRAKYDIDRLGSVAHRQLVWISHEGVTMKGFEGKQFTLWELK